MQGVEEQVAGLRWRHRRQQKAQLLSGGEPLPCEGSAGLAVRDGIPPRRHRAELGEAHQTLILRHCIGAQHQGSADQAVQVNQQLQNGDLRREPHGYRGHQTREISGLACLAQAPGLHQTGAPCSIACSSRRTWVAPMAVRQCCNGEAWWSSGWGALSHASLLAGSSNTV